MSITFHCAHCGKEIKAPDTAAGRRGKCPYCSQSNYIPAPVSEDELPALAPEDAEYERHRREEIEELRRKERDLIAEAPSELRTEPAGEQKTELGPEDLRTLVINYCLDAARSSIGTLDGYVRKLRASSRGLSAVDDVLKGRSREPALKNIPPKVIEGFLKGLRDRLS